MEDPVSQIPLLIHGLTSHPAPHQQHILSTFFLPNASFSHPLVYVPSFALRIQNPLTNLPLIALDSRDVILGIYRWYRMLSPRIDMRITSVAWDQGDRGPAGGLSYRYSDNDSADTGSERTWPPHDQHTEAVKSKLYVTCTQVLHFWFLPGFLSRREAGFVVCLNLERHEVDEMGMILQPSTEGDTDTGPTEHMSSAGSPPRTAHTPVSSRPATASSRPTTAIDRVDTFGNKESETVAWDEELLYGTEGRKERGFRTRWFVTKQTDLYPLEEWTSFLFFIPGLVIIVRLMQLFSMVFCYFQGQLGAITRIIPSLARDKCLECDRLELFQDHIEEEGEVTVGNRSWQDVNAEMESSVSRRLQDRI